MPQTDRSFAIVCRHSCNGAAPDHGPIRNQTSGDDKTMTTNDSKAPPARAPQNQAAWRDRLASIGRDHGFFTPIGQDHLGLFVQEGDTLVVSFDSAARIIAEEPGGLPLGFEAVQRKEWSLLSIMSLDDHWFRATELMAFFDRLAHSRFFESFTHVIFLGFGPAAGHAACVYSAAAPNARVLATTPAATLRPELAGFDRRFLAARRYDFSRYGDAPGLVASALRTVIIYDPTEALATAHAAQFRGPQVTLAPLRFTGTAPERLIRHSGLLTPMLRALCRDRLTSALVAGFIRPVRRADHGYLHGLIARARRQGQTGRAWRIADYAADVTGQADFAALAAQLAPSTKS
jgi:hypothetical protein